MKRRLIKFSTIIGFCLLFPTVFTLFMNRSNNVPKETISSGKTIIVNSGSQTVNMDMEDFIPCVLVNQLSIDSPTEAIKAQSVVIRTYILSYLGNNEQINAEDLNLPYTLYDDLKNIVGDDYVTYYTKLKDTVQETFGQTIKYDEKLITPYFHSISAGVTRNGTEALATDTFPYLMSVDSTYDTSADNYLTITYLEKNEFVEILKKYAEDIVIDEDDPLATCQVLGRCSAGYISSIQIGDCTFSGDEIQMIFSLASPYFEIENYENQIRIICKGNGHGLGLSIFGATAMASEGHTYKDILTYYYSGVTIE